MKEAVERLAAVGVGASPPCQAYSTVLADGSTATSSPGIPQVAASLRGLGLPFWVENVLGADAEELEEQMTILRGPMFGLPVDRGRRFWTSFPFHLDAALSEGGMRLRQRCCLGARRRWMRLDPFGRPVRSPCCRGNLYPVQGGAPTRSTVEENARAMGVDEGHMSWAGLAQSIPPPMAELVAGQMAMMVAHDRFGAPRITYDDFEARPSWARRQLRRWLRGAGDDAPDAGLELRSGRCGEPEIGSTHEAGNSAGPSDPRWTPPPEPADVAAPPSGEASWEDVRWGLPEGEWREIYYAHTGGFTQSVLEPGAPWWLGAMHRQSPYAPDEMTLERLRGQNTFVHCAEPRLRAVWALLCDAARRDERGTRVSVVLPAGAGSQWASLARAAGMRELDTSARGVARHTSIVEHSPHA